MIKGTRFFGLTILGLFLGLVIYQSNYSSNITSLSSLNDPAPNFTLNTIEGNRVSLSDYKGQGVFLVFFATYCQLCRKEIPFLQKHYEQMKEKGITVLAINIGESNKKVEHFLVSKKLTFPTVIDERGEVINLYNVTYIPVSYLIDKDGRIVQKITDPLTNENIPTFMKKIVP